MRAELGLDADAFVVATIGMLRPEKRQDDLLRVVQQLRQREIPAIALVVGTPTAEKAAFGPGTRWPMNWASRPIPYSPAIAATSTR